MKWVGSNKGVIILIVAGPTERTVWVLIKMIIIIVFIIISTISSRSSRSIIIKDSDHSISFLNGFMIIYSSVLVAYSKPTLINEP